MKSTIQRHPLGAILLLVGWVLMMAGPAAAATEETQPKVDYEAGFYYTVKKGDTLWDLSQRFSDSPWQWPDLWQENKQLANPHWIYPGERIRLFRKAGWHETDKPDLKEVPALAPQVEATQPEPPPQLTVEFSFPNIDEVGFIRHPAVDPLGVIFKSLKDKLLISRGDTVYIRYTGGRDAFQPGARMTVYRTIDTDIKDITDKSQGNQHLLLGVAEIVTLEPEYAVAKIIESYRAILLEDKLMAYEPRSPAIPVVASAPDMVAKIIVGEEHNLIMGDHMVAFMDKGADDRITPGQVYNIYQQESANIHSQGKTKLKPVMIGSLIVLHTEKDNSTVYITGSKDRVIPGQLVMTP